jgi:zinc transporter ZupT
MLYWRAFYAKFTRNGKMNPFFQLLFFGALAATGNLLGGFLITKAGSAGHERLKFLVAVGAGFMLGAVFLELIPEIFSQWQPAQSAAMGWLLAGYLSLQLVEHTLVPHFHFGEEIHTETIRRKGVALTAVIALSIHTFFDGVAIAAGMLTNLKLGIVLFVAILLHKIPEGFTVASIMLTSGRGIRAAFQASLLIATTTFLGILSVAMLRSSIILYALPFSAGVSLYVAASDLIPEVNHEGGARTSMMVFAGVALFYLTHLLLHNALGS